MNLQPLNIFMEEANVSVKQGLQMALGVFCFALSPAAFAHTDTEHATPPHRIYAAVDLIPLIPPTVETPAPIRNKLPSLFSVDAPPTLF
jgi:hypothetical protein